MEESLSTCNMEFLSISVIVVLGILTFVAVKKCFLKFLELRNSMRARAAHQRSITVNLHWEVVEMRKTTQKISKYWGEMKDMVSSVKEQQAVFQERLEREMGLLSQVLQDCISTSDEEYTKNSQRFQHLVDFFRCDFNTLKDMIKNYGETLLKSIEQFQPQKDNLLHMWTQTEHEVMVRKGMRSKSWDDKKILNETQKSSSSGIKRLLLDFQKEARKNSLKEREEMMSHVEMILNQINEDRELIKSHIRQAFATSSYQSQKSFEQFGTVGQEAMNFIAEKTENHNVLMRDKFQEFDKKLKIIFEGMQNTSFDVSSIKNTLDNIDTQMDDIFQRIEIGCQKNVEHCEEVLGGLETATDVWKDSSKRLSEMAQLLAVITSGVEHLMNELTEKPNESKDLQQKVSDLPQDKLALQSAKWLIDETGSSEKTLSVQVFLHLQNTAKTCTSRISFLSERLDSGTREIKMAIENLLRQIRFMCDLVESVGERFKFLEKEACQQKTDQNNSLKKELFGDTIVNKEKSKDKIIVEGITDCKTTGDFCTKPPKKAKATLKLRNSGSPKKGKTIYSDISSLNACSKNQGIVRK